MMQHIPLTHISKTSSARVDELDEGVWHLEIPASPRRSYRLAQLDDYGRQKKHSIPNLPPLTMSLHARVSSQSLPGTWGFGFWNDPFSKLLASAGTSRRFPTLPQAVWFFHASPESYLSFRDDLPAHGLLAATFRSINIFPVWLALASPAVAFALIPGVAQLVRRLLRRMIQQSAAHIETNVASWHSYALSWKRDQVSFFVDEAEIMHTDVSPIGPLTPVIWIDNQFAAMPPNGVLRAGTLPTAELSWLEVRQLSVEDCTDVSKDESAD